MARVPIVNESYYEGNYRTPADRYHSGSGSSSSSANSRHEHLNNTIAEQVINSPAYKSAFQILSLESDKSWLQRLEMIPYSVSDASPTIFDDFGLSNKYNDKQDANFQYCMEQISALMAEYQSWKNSLPTTQTQQMADAGINSAITGQGVNGSTIPNVGVSTNPSSLPSTQPFELIRDAASFILDTTSGLASLALQYKQLGLSTRTQQFSEDSALLDFKKYASEQGISVNGNATWQDIIKEYGWKVDDPAGMSRYSDNILRKYLTHHANSSVISGLAAVYPSISAMMEVKGDDRPYVFTGIEQSPIYLDETNKAMISLLSSQREYDAKIKKFTMESAEYNAGKAFTEKTSAEFKKIVAEYESTRAEIATSLIKALSNSENESDKLLLSRILWNATYNTVELEQKQNDWFTADKVSGVIGNIF